MRFWEMCNGDSQSYDENSGVEKCGALGGGDDDSKQMLQRVTMKQYEIKKNPR